MPDKFFDQRYSWSGWKHDILKKYLHVWVSKLSYSSRDLAYIDGCAGAGTYGDGADGSPVIAAKWNDDFLRARGKRLLVLACEQDPAAAASLRAALAPWTLRAPAEAAVLEGSFVNALPTLLAQTRAVPTFVFIDPYGMQSLTADELRPLLKKEDARAPTEVLLRVEPVLLARFSGWLRRKARSPKGQKTADAFRKRLGRYNISDELLAELEVEGGVAPLASAAPRTAVLLRRYLQLFEERFAYVQIIPIRPSYFAAPKYFLVHGTDSEHGAAKINDAVSTTEDALFEATLRAEDAKDAARGQGSLFDAAPTSRPAPVRPPRVSIADAERAIRTRLADGKPHQWIRVRAALSMQFGPDLREKDHRAALVALRDRGEVAVLNPTASRAIGDNTRVQWVAGRPPR